jgi:hypothetical protein
VPARVQLRTRECRVVLDFTEAVITSNVLRIETDMVHGKLIIVGGMRRSWAMRRLRVNLAAAWPDPRSH